MRQESLHLHRSRSALLFEDRTRGQFISSETERYVHTNVAPNRSYIFDVVRPDESVYGDFEGRKGHPSGQRALANVPRLKHTSRKREENQ